MVRKCSKIKKYRKVVNIPQKLKNTHSYQKINFGTSCSFYSKYFVDFKQHNVENYSQNISYKIDEIRHPYWSKTNPFKCFMIDFLLNETNIYKKCV